MGFEILDRVRERAGQGGREKRLLETLDELAQVFPNATLRCFYEDTIAIDENRNPTFGDVASAIRKKTTMGQYWNIALRDTPFPYGGVQLSTREFLLKLADLSEREQSFDRDAEGSMKPIE